jgi:hypothetical protein
MIESGQLTHRAGTRNARLIDINDLDALTQKIQDEPSICPVCEKPARPGREWHAECLRTPRGRAIIAQGSWDRLDPKQRRRRMSQLLASHLTPEGVARWYWRRHKSTKLYGRLGREYGIQGAADGIEAGRAKGGRHPLSTPEQQQEMYRLSLEGRSIREIAEAVFGDARYRNRVHRFLQR